MSEQSLMEIVRARVLEQISNNQTYLCEGFSADENKLRIYQGTIAGLRLAIDIFEMSYREGR